MNTLICFLITFHLYWTVNTARTYHGVRPLKKNCTCTYQNEDEDTAAFQNKPLPAMRTKPTQPIYSGDTNNPSYKQMIYIPIKISPVLNSNTAIPANREVFPGTRFIDDKIEPHDRAFRTSKEPTEHNAISSEPDIVTTYRDLLQNKPQDLQDEYKPFYQYDENEVLGNNQEQAPQAMPDYEPRYKYQQVPEPESEETVIPKYDTVEPEYDGQEMTELNYDPAYKQEELEPVIHHNVLPEIINDPGYKRQTIARKNIPEFNNDPEAHEVPATGYGGDNLSEVSYAPPLQHEEVTEVQEMPEISDYPVSQHHEEPEMVNDSHEEVAEPGNTGHDMGGISYEPEYQPEVKHHEVPENSYDPEHQHQIVQPDQEVPEIVSDPGYQLLEDPEMTHQKMPEYSSNLGYQYDEIAEPEIEDEIPSNVNFRRSMHLPKNNYYARYKPQMKTQSKPQKYDLSYGPKKVLRTLQLPDVEYHTMYKPRKIDATKYLVPKYDLRYQPKQVQVPLIMPGANYYGRYKPQNISYSRVPKYNLLYEPKQGQLGGNTANQLPAAENAPEPTTERQMYGVPKYNIRYIPSQARIKPEAITVQHRYKPRNITVTESSSQESPEVIYDPRYRLGTLEDPKFESQELKYIVPHKIAVPGHNLRYAPNQVSEVPDGKYTARYKPHNVSMFEPQQYAAMPRYNLKYKPKPGLKAQLFTDGEYDVSYEPTERIVLKPKNFRRFVIKEPESDAVQGNEAQTSFEYLPDKQLIYDVPSSEMQTDRNRYYYPVNTPKRKTYSALMGNTASDEGDSVDGRRYIIKRIKVKPGLPIKANRIKYIVQEPNSQSAEITPTVFYNGASTENNLNSSKLGGDLIDMKLVPNMNGIYKYTTIDPNQMNVGNKAPHIIHGTINDIIHKVNYLKKVIKPKI